MNWSELAIPAIHVVETVLIVIWATYIYRTLTGDKVATINSISPQPWGIVIVMLGFGMLISCKKWGIDTTIAGGVIGAGVNMLTGKHNDNADLPPGSKTTTQIPPLTVTTETGNTSNLPTATTNKAETTNVTSSPTISSKP